jgi:hypothetical protein
MEQSTTKYIHNKPNGKRIALPECNSSKMMPKGMMQAKKKASSS